MEIKLFDWFDYTAIGIAILAVMLFFILVWA